MSSGYVPPTSGATSTSTTSSSIPAFFSEDPSAWASLTPAQQAGWNASQGQTQPTTAAPTTGAVTAPAQTAAPATPTANPLQPTYLPNPPTAQATTYTNTYDPTTATNELNQAASVQDTQQNQNLMSMLAAQGVSAGSSAAQGAAQNLANTQTAALAPSLVSAQEYGAGLNEQAGLANAGASNQMTLQNLQDLLQTQQYNATAANTAGTNSAEMQNQDWLAQLEAELGLQQTGLSGSNSLAGDQANQTVPLNPSLFSQIMAPIESGASDYASAS